MKKLFGLVGGVILCVMLTACGNGSTSKGNDYADLIEMLDKGQYEAARLYIDGLEANANEPEEEKEEEKEESLLSKVYGEWITSGGSEEQPQSIVIDENGTCTIGDETLTWKVENEDEDRRYITLTVYEGKKAKYSLSISNNEISISMNLGVASDNGGYTYSGSSYMNLSHYDAIEITAENWQDYFEVEENHKFQYNAFNEFEDFYISQKILLKEAYVGKINMSLSNVVMELSFTNGSKGCQLDIANETYTLTDTYNVYGTVDDIYEFWGQEEGQYGTSIMNSSYNKDNSELMNYKTDMQLLRVQGTIYIKK